VKSKEEKMQWIAGKGSKWKGKGGLASGGKGENGLEFERHFQYFEAI
jgi:hypothetical protein